MQQKEYYCAIDLGATSGRVIIAPKDGGGLEEVRRFPHGIKERDGQFFWNIEFLLSEIRAGLLALVECKDIRILSIGVDTWGVDMVFLDADGGPLAPPRAYRDPYTEGMIERFAEKVPLDEVYERTGIQFMPFNTLFQLFACSQQAYKPFLEASHYLFVPDYINYVLSGRMACEYTILSTSQFLNPYTKQIDEKLITAAGARMECFPEVVMPGTVLGTLLPEVADFGYEIPIIAVAGHDTASAVASIDDTPGTAFLSSGTWSLMGIVTNEPVITKRSRELNFTNEGGIGGTTRVLKNITGMWILEQCRKEWQQQGKEYSYETLILMYDEGDDFVIFNPDDDCFANPPSMITAIHDYSLKHSLPPPASDAALIRSIFRSMAARYAEVFGWLQELSLRKIERLYIIGGGAKNSLLNRLTEEAIGVPVIVGSTEATAIGNIKIQKTAI